MKVLGATLLCGLLMAAGAALASADEVDDLLAGKPITTDEVPALSFDSPALQDRILSPAESAALHHDPAWHATIKNAPQPNKKPAAESAKATQPASESAPASDVSLVPEPSAIALGVGAILYFLIFFRRRHLP